MNEEIVTTVEGKSSPFDIMNLYIQDVKTIPLLKKEEEIHAFEDIKNAELDLISFLFKTLKDENCWNNLFSLASAQKLKIPTSLEEAKIARSSRGKTIPNGLLKNIRLTDPGWTWILESCEMLIAESHSRQTRIISNKISKFKANILKAKNNFASRNLRLVLSVARKYFKSAIWNSSLDLVQEGNIGLVRAINSYDVERGLKFSTYACWWIRHHIQRSIDDTEKVIRSPVYQIDAERQVYLYTKKFLSVNGRYPDEHELSKEMGIEVSKLRNIIDRQVGQVMRLDQPISKEGDQVNLYEIVTDEDFISVDNKLIHHQLMKNTNSLLSKLTPQQATVIRYRFGMDGTEEKTLKEIGTMFNLCRERIRQIENEALRTMRREANLNRLV